MDEKLKNEILNILIRKNPNWVNESIIKHNLTNYDAHSFEAVMGELCQNEQVEKDVDRRSNMTEPVTYYKMKSTSNLPIRNSIIIGEVEVPRVLSCEKPRYFPENINESLEHLAKYSKSLHDYESKLQKVEKEQRNYWAKTISIFTILAGLLAVILDRLPKTVTDPELEIKHLLWQNFLPLIPFCLITIIFALVIYFILKK